MSDMNNTDSNWRFADKVEEDLIAKIHHNKRTIEKLASTFGITDRTLIKELTELAIVRRTRAIAHSTDTHIKKFHDIVDLYYNQVNLSHRTSQSILLQQYSTPAPIGYLAGVFVNADKGVSFFEPSAGNGLLTIVALQQNVTVNEIDNVRRANLQTQGYKKVMGQDATLPFKEFKHKFDAVITNPPFGTLDNAVMYETFPIKTLDHLMALRALDTMKDTGKAAIIIGGHTHWDEKGRIQAGKNRIFFNYLYSRYNVVDIINIDGGLYSRQGTSFDVRLILIDGRKAEPKGAARVFDKYIDNPVTNFADLLERITDDMRKPIDKPVEMNPSISELEREALNLAKEFPDTGLGAPYIPASEGCVVLNTQVPDSMSFETQSALTRVREAVGGDIDEFICNRLKYRSRVDLCKALSAEQIDAVAMCIYNIEARGQGMIIGDQTGIGKGRVAAAMIRYGVCQGIKPIFITEKANLFSDINRDLVAIGSEDLVPFIINGKESKTDIKDENGNVVYQALPQNEQAAIFKDEKIPAKYDFVVATYSQFNSAEKRPEKPNFLNTIAENNILIMDESHNSSGSSNTGEFMQGVVGKSKGVVFLSATFAKRPDNMPIYAMKTSISEANMTKDELVEAIIKGGVALQEVLSSQLVAEGQMIRRERSFEGIEVNYITLDEKEQEHRAIADNITEILRDIIAFQSNFVDAEVEELDKIAVAEGKEVNLRDGTSQAGVDNQPYFSKIFNVINQMLFSIKSEAVADRAIARLKEDKKPVIAFSSTMGSFIEQIENTRGMSVSDGDTINTDFAEVLKRGLEGVMRYTVKDVDGKPEYKEFDISQFTDEARAEYQRIIGKINKISTGITISPIDVVIKKIEDAGYSVAEVTGRKYTVQLNTKTNTGVVLQRKRINTNDAFREFNNNEVDNLMINQSGSTGASAHAVPTAKVPASEVKQRVMIVLQAELDINIEVQKRGRINRTGQILKPVYDYINSAIPAEKRLMMMLQKKLKSLDANTTSNQKQSNKILDVPDFLNKYGDKVVKEYLIDNPEINKLLNDPLNIEKSGKESTETVEEAANKVSGRVAVLSTKMQQEFYDEIAERYNNFVEYLKQVGDYDLEVEAMNLEAELVNWSVIKMGKGGESAFGDDSILETVKANVLKKPFTKIELDNLLTEALGERDSKTIQKELLGEFATFIESRLAEDKTYTNEKYDELIKNVPNEKKILKIIAEEGQGAADVAIKLREEELEIARTAQHEYNTKTLTNRKLYLDRVLNFFHTGRKVNYPYQSYEQGQELVLAVFLGFIIDRKKKNHFAPSSLRLRFAISNSNKYIAIPASYADDITAIIGASMDIQDESRKDLLGEWEKAIKENVTDRRIRHIITGNLLQAFGDHKGKLVSYTAKNGETKKGILMPESWNPTENIGGKVVVPIIRAMTIIKSLKKDGAIYTNNDMGIFRQGEDYRIIVPLARQKGGEVYLDSDLLKLVDKNNFEKLADKMVATVPLKNIVPFIEIIQQKISASVTLSAAQFEMIKNEPPKKQKPMVKIIAPPKHDESNDNDIKMFEYEAEALALEFELMAA
jgi:predicted RNA methylase